MKIFSSKKRVAAIGVVTAATLVGGGMAYAYFTASGTGTGTATTGASTAWDVAVDSTTAGNLTPTTLSGNPVQSVGYDITNVGTGQQSLSKAVISVATVVPGTSPVAVAGPNACTAADFSIGGAPINTAFTQTLGAPANNYAPGFGYSGSVDLRLVDNGANQDKCQGATVTLQVVAS